MNKNELLKLTTLGACKVAHRLHQLLTKRRHAAVEVFHVRQVLQLLDERVVAKDGTAQAQSVRCARAHVLNHAVFHFLQNCTKRERS
jgi:hypothetical protein